MIRDIFDRIKEGQDVRGDLIQLRAKLKENNTKTALLYYMGQDIEIFDTLLIHEDPKVRKNAALIIGELSLPGFLDKLYEAYNKESQMFVKSSYLVAMGGYDFSEYRDKLNLRIDELNQTVITEANKKHRNEELQALSKMMIQLEGVKKHIFTGYNMPVGAVLLTNRNYNMVTLEQLGSTKAKLFNAGVMLQTNELGKVLPIRTYGEILFYLNDLKTCSNDYKIAAKEIEASSLLAFLKQCHEGEYPFYFRIELKSKMELDKKSAFTKKLGMEIELLTKRKLINTTSNYEVELRFIENKEGSYNLLLKMYTLKDERFTYRKNVVAASIQPHNAALVLALAKKYLKKDAQVLDPFCGVGTMLAERKMIESAGTMYGLDIYSTAIERAKENLGRDFGNMFFINRDFFDFTHEHLFDEIITNMPRVMGHKEEEEILLLYKRFFTKASKHLNEDGIIILYSHNPEYTKKYSVINGYKILEEFEINKKEGAYVYVLKLK